VVLVSVPNRAPYKKNFLLGLFSCCSSSSVQVELSVGGAKMHVTHIFQTSFLAISIANLAIAWDQQLVRFNIRKLVGGLVASNIALNPTPSFVPENLFDVPIFHSVAVADTLQSAEAQTISIFEGFRPSVVFINTYVEQIDIFSMNVMEVAAGTGSGFVWDKEGHIVTNYHVIRNAGSAKVVFVQTKQCAYFQVTCCTNTFCR
jgi:S1-C subfamily serine protease